MANMAYELKVIEHFRKVPVFSLSDVNQIIKNRAYAKKFIKKMIGGGKIFKIKKGMYTLYNDSFLASTFIEKPSYISGASALGFHKVITQIPRDVFCSAKRKSFTAKFAGKIRYSKTKHFFGYKLEDYENFKIPIADNEKAVIDSIGITPIHIIEEAFDEIEESKMIAYLEKIKKSEVVKRIGFLMEKNGFDVYCKLNKYTNYKYILLDPLGNKRGIKNKKWGIYINT